MKSEINVVNAKKITISSLLLALTVITLFFASVLPINRLALYALSSFFVSIIITEFKIKAGWIFYVASCLLSLIVVQVKIGIIPYMVFFGVYGIIKYYIEKLNNIALEYILKLVYFNICLVAASAFIEKVLFVGISNIKLPIWLGVAVLEVVFVIYDYVYTLFVQYYSGKLKKMLRI
jgi:hypothetical protein